MIWFGLAVLAGLFAVAAIDGRMVRRQRRRGVWR
jgi:hypothetical protein